MAENQTTLSAVEQEAVRNLVSEALNSTAQETARNVAKQVYTELRGAETAVVGDDLSPMWARHAVRFLNAIAAKKDGNMAKASELFKSFMDDRTGLNAAATAYENREAMRIIQGSSLGRESQMRLLSTLSDAAGGFLLPKPFLAEIFVTLEEYGVARRTFRGIPMSSKTLDLKDVATKPVVVWEAENARIDATAITFGNKQLVAKKLAALLPWTMEFQEDEVFGIIPLASRLFGEALALREDSAAFLGGGSLDTANGGFTGMLNLAGADVYTMPNTKTSFDDVTFDDLNTAKNRLSLARQRNARWFVHHSIVGVLERIRENGTTGAYIYRQPSAPGQPGTMWGYPVEQVEVMPNLGDSAAGARFIAFGDPSNMLFGTRRGVTFDIGNEATILTDNVNTSYSAFQQDGAVLRVTERIAFQTPLDSNFVVIRTAAS
jgi:HK97 family phage major capsid protein